MNLMLRIRFYEASVCMIDNLARNTGISLFCHNSYCKTGFDFSRVHIPTIQVH